MRARGDASKINEQGLPGNGYEGHGLNIVFVMHIDLDFAIAPSPYGWDLEAMLWVPTKALKMVGINSCLGGKSSAQQ
ncbi:MAG: hypothetical protein Q9224_004500 [Gallowayella concinna]